MALDAERIIDLAPSDQFGLIDRYLPDPYRRALSRDGDPMAGLTRVTREALRRALSELESVQRSRALAFFNDLSDGALLGALHDQSPWPEDTIDSFRDRLTRVSALAMRGAATADRLLMLAAIACDATRLSSGDGAQLLGPRADYAFSLVQRGPDGAETIHSFAGLNDAGQCRRFVRKNDGSAVFPVDVFDAPLRRFETDITPISEPDGGPDQGFRFVLNNPGSETLAGLTMSDPVIWPDPYFEVTAGDAPFGPFAFVNVHSGQTICVNRTIAAGGSLTIDTRQMAWSHGDKDHSALGRLTCLGDKQAVYAGFGLTLDDHRFGNGPIGPLVSLRAKDRIAFSGQKWTAPISATALSDDMDLIMPSLLGEGQTQWRMIQLSDDTPASSDIHEARFCVVPQDADIQVKAHWYARRPGEFCLSVPQAALAPDMTGPLAHRKVWLDDMVERFKLGGTVRISQDLLLTEFEGFEETTELTLTSKVAASDVVLLTDPLELRDKVQPADTIEVLEGQSFEGLSALTLKDEVQITKTDVAADVLVSSVEPADRISISAGLPADFTSSVAPTDDVTVLPELSFSLRDSVIPTTDVSVADDDTRPNDLVSVLVPQDRVDVREALPAQFRSGTQPTDSVTLLPEVGVDFRADPASPLDFVDVTNDDVAPDTLTSVLGPNDDVVITPGLPADFDGQVMPTDEVVILPEVGLTFADAPVPIDDVTVVEDTANAGPFVSGLDPTDRVLVTAGLPSDLGSSMTPTDFVTVIPEVSLEWRDPIAPIDDATVVPGVVDIALPPSKLQPDDRITVAPEPHPDLVSSARPTDTIVIDPGSAPNDGGTDADDDDDDDDGGSTPGGGVIFDGGGDGFNEGNVALPFVTPIGGLSLRRSVLRQPPQLNLGSSVQATDRITIRTRPNRRRQRRRR